MECTSEFRELANHNPFVHDLGEQGYTLDLINGYFVVFDVPYLDSERALKYGTLAAPITLVDGRVGPPPNHQVWYQGDPPCDGLQQRLSLGSAPNPATVAEDLVMPTSLSFKLKDDSGQLIDYASFADKIVTYLAKICGPALQAYPDAIREEHRQHQVQRQGSPLRLADTFSARYGINDVSFKLRGKKVAIIGLGGTGSFVLDFLARTHAAEIALFDDDVVDSSSVFRSPGFIPNAQGKLKVYALAQHYYTNWHAGIVAYPERITQENREIFLRDRDFVFVSVDDGPSRRDIVEWLTQANIPFVDCGLGLNTVAGGLNGMVRITGVDRAAYEQTVGTPYLPSANAAADDYRKQGQIAELNSLNAALALIRFKQHFGMFARFDDGIAYCFETGSFDMDRQKLAG